MYIKPKKTLMVKTLISSFVVIAVCEMFFLLDISADMFGLDIDTSWIDHNALEFVSTIALAFALIAIAVQIKWLLQENRDARETVDIASGKLVKVIFDKFNYWALTPTEQEIGLLLIKGFSVQEIANIRTTQIGTVKSQSSSIYHKANVKGRNELVAYFVEDLLGEESLISENKIEK